MKPAPALLLLLSFLIACTTNETIRDYGAGDGVWELAELNGAPFAATATLQFTDRQQIGGNGPCNAWSARMDAPYPRWNTGEIIATKRGCPELAAESAFFEALSAARLSSAREGRLVLSSGDGTPLLVFTPAG